MAVEGDMIATETQTVFQELEEAQSIIIVFGYGMAVAQAQSSVSEMTRRLRASGKMVRSQYIQ